jgi:hypothetical protein
MGFQFRPGLAGLFALTVDMMLTGPEHLSASMARGQTTRHGENRKDALCFSPYLYRARNLNGASTSSSIDPLRQTSSQLPRIHLACLNTTMATRL